MKSSAVDNKFVVYIHKNKINNKVYVGITSKNPERRWGKYGTGYRSNVYFWNSIQKYGWDGFEHIIVAKNLSMNEATNIEKELISKYKSNLLEYGYNFTSGGEINQEFSEESKRKMSEKAKMRIITEEHRIHLSESRKGVKPWNVGISPSEKTRKKIAESQLGRKHTEESIEKMRDVAWKNTPVQIDGIIFRSMTECSKYLGFGKSKKLSAWLRGENSMPEEYKDRGLSYVGVEAYYILDESVTQDKTVICDEIEFSSMLECDRYYNLPRCTTGHWLSGRREMPQEFIDKGLRYGNAKRYFYKIVIC